MYINKFGKKFRSMIVYTFNVVSLTKKTVNGIPDIVTTVVWERTGIDEDGHTGTFKVANNLDISNVGIGTSIEIIPYSDLTKDTIMSWIASMNSNEDVKSYIQEQIQRSIDREVQIESGEFPWEV